MASINCREEIHQFTLLHCEFICLCQKALQFKMLRRGKGKSMIPSDLTPKIIMGAARVQHIFQIAQHYSEK